MARPPAPTGGFVLSWDYPTPPTGWIWSTGRGVSENFGFPGAVEEKSLAVGPSSNRGSNGHEKFVRVDPFSVYQNLKVQVTASAVAAVTNFGNLLPCMDSVTVADKHSVVEHVRIPRADSVAVGNLDQVAITT